METTITAEKAVTKEDLDRAIEYLKRERCKEKSSGTPPPFVAEDELKVIPLNGLYEKKTRKVVEVNPSEWFRKGFFAGLGFIAAVVLGGFGVMVFGAFLAVLTGR